MDGIIDTKDSMVKSAAIEAYYNILAGKLQLFFYYLNMYNL